MNCLILAATLFVSGDCAVSCNRPVVTAVVKSVNFIRERPVRTVLHRLFHRCR